MQVQWTKAVLNSSVAAIAILSAGRALAQTATDNSKSTIETIVVTAEKRSEAVGDIPMSVSAITGEDLTREHATRFEDYVNSVPGLNLIQDSPTQNQIVIRGITEGSAPVSSTVAVYVDETPYSAEGAFQNSGIAPNLDTYDLQRVEVLRGPQGTLYGANALGGIMKFVTNAPDPSGFAASVQVGGSTVENGNNGFDLHGMVNIPIADDLAVRLVGYDNYYPGFIDDPSRGLKDINGDHEYGGRASLLYQPSANFSIRLSAIYQDISASDNNSEDVNPVTLTPSYGSLTQERLISQPTETKNQLLNATVNWDVGFAKILSSTSYASTPYHGIADYTSYYGAYFVPNGVDLYYEFFNRSFTQEVRISSPSDSSPLQWQVGGYYDHEQSRSLEQNYLIDPVTHDILYSNPVNIGRLFFLPKYEEHAAFADFDYFILPTFDVGAGGRYSSNSQSDPQQYSGILAGMSSFTTVSSQDVFTYSADARWHWTPETMLYARLATGYAPGGPNDVIPSSPLPEEYKDSTTTNYELGVKSTLFDGKVSADVSLFEVDWRSIQVETFFGNLYALTNGGKAKSDGVEWDFGYVPISGLTLNLNGAYDDARLTEALPSPPGGSKGSLLPYAPLWETTFSANYEHSLFGDYSGFLGVDWRYNGSREADFSDPGPREHLASYNMANLRAGVEFANYTLTLYVKNIGNTIAFSSVTEESFAGGFGPQSATVISPRTIGIDLAANF